MNMVLTLSQMKGLSIEEIIRLYKIGYRLEGNIAQPEKRYVSSVDTIASPIVDPFINFGKVTVSQGYDNLETNIVLNPGSGTIFPDPSISGQYNLVWWNSTDYGDPSDDPNKEIVRCIVVSGDTLVITRAQEGTTASIKNLTGKTYKMALAITAKVFTDLQTDAQSRVDTGILAHSSSTSSIHGVMGDIVGTSDVQTLTNKTITDSTNNIMAKSLKSSTTAIDVSTSSAPSTGQILMATSPTSATWQSLSTPNRSSFIAQIVNAPTTGSFLPNIPIPDGFSLIVRATVTNAGQIYIGNSVANATSAAIPGNRNILNAGDAAKLYVSNANLVAVASSISGNTVDILVEQ
jgi:hypothetical protein